MARFIVFDVETAVPARRFYEQPKRIYSKHRDSRACAEILLRYLEAGAEVKDFIRTCSFKK